MTEGNIKSSPTAWSSVLLNPATILVRTPTDDEVYWRARKSCLDEEDDPIEDG